MLGAHFQLFFFASTHLPINVLTWHCLQHLACRESVGWSSHSTQLRHWNRGWCWRWWRGWHIPCTHVHIPAQPAHGAVRLQAYVSDVAISHMTHPDMIVHTHLPTPTLHVCARVSGEPHMHGPHVQPALLARYFLTKQCTDPLHHCATLFKSCLIVTCFKKHVPLCLQMFPSAAPSRFSKHPAAEPQAQWTVPTSSPTTHLNTRTRTWGPPAVPCPKLYDQVPPAWARQASPPRLARLHYCSLVAI